MNIKEKMDFIDKLLNFKEKVTILGIQNKSIASKDIDQIREVCKNGEKIHKFNLEVSDNELIKEIFEFLNEI